MNFLLANLSIVNGARYVGEGDQKKLIISVHITSRLAECPYPGKFQQVDYDVNLTLPEDRLPSELDDILPGIAQNWINEKYPNT